MTKVRSKRGRLVHAVTPHGTRRDLAPEDIPEIECGRKLKGAVIVDDHVSCPACIHILFVGN